MIPAILRALLVSCILFSPVLSRLHVLPKEVFLADGDVLHLHCHIPPPLLTNYSALEWRIGGFTLGGFSSVNLSLAYASSLNPAVFSCHLVLGDGSVVDGCGSAVYTATLGTDFGSEASQDVRGPVGGVAILSCAPPPSQPAPTIGWLRKGGGGLPSGASVLVGGDLYLPGLLRSQAGEYQCVVGNGRLGQQRKGPLVRLRVVERSTPTNSINFYKQPSNVTIEMGKPLILPCTAWAYPILQYNWTFQAVGEALQNLPHDPALGYLSLASVTMADSGVYTCTAFDDSRSVQANATVTVVAVPASVRITQEVRDDAILLTCEAMPPGDYDIAWTAPRQLPIQSLSPRNEAVSVPRPPPPSTPSASTSGPAGWFQCRVSSRFGCATAEEWVEAPPLPQPRGISSYSPMESSSPSSWLLVAPTPSTDHTPSPSLQLSDLFFEVPPTGSSSLPVQSSSEPHSSTVAVTTTPKAVQVGFHPPGPHTLVEGQNFTLTCRSSDVGLLELRMGASVLEAVWGVSVEYRLVHVSAASIGDYSCKLTLLTGPVILVKVNVEVQALLPRTPPLGVKAFVFEGQIYVQWSAVKSEPGRSVEGIKLNWGSTSPLEKVASISVGAAERYVAFQPQMAGLIFIEVWLYNKAGDGPSVAVNVTIVDPSASLAPVPPSSAPTVLSSAPTVLSSSSSSASSSSATPSATPPPPTPSATLPPPKPSATPPPPTPSTSLPPPKPSATLPPPKPSATPPPPKPSATPPPPTPSAGPVTTSFDKKHYVAVAGETITITCRTSSPTYMRLFRHHSGVLSEAYMATSVSYTFRQVNLTDALEYFCFSSGTTEDILVPATLHVVEAGLCSRVSSDKIRVKVTPEQSWPHGVDPGITINYVRLPGDRLFSAAVDYTLHSVSLNRTGSAILGNLQPDTSYRVTFSKTLNAGQSKPFGRCDEIKTFKAVTVTRDLLAVTGVTESGATVSLIKLKDLLEKEGIPLEFVQVQVKVLDQWRAVNMSVARPLLKLEGHLRNVSVRVRIGEGPWMVATVTLPLPAPGPIHHAWLYLIIIGGSVVVAVLVGVCVVSLKLVQSRRRDQDKDTDHREVRLSRQSSVKSSVSWSANKVNISPSSKDGLHPNSKSV